ncbi:matrixin family metalloprotease [Aeoliella sp. SH292]|uniref:matrixin family metalloprotease n=1 Tax=Aeoliella sp. SH292 TaxID=3454464 RepID=UPI003F9B4BD5
MVVADVAVVANRTPRRVPVEITVPGTPAWQVTLTPGESRPIFADGASSISFMSGQDTKQYTLEPANVYFLGAREDGTIDLQRIGLGETSPFVAGLPGSAANTPPATIPVKILVDDDEPMRQLMWEGKLRKRIAAASEILHRHAMVKLEVVAVDTWTTDNATNDFHTTLAEFEKTVDPFPGQLAIGFSSQYEVAEGRVHMGGTRGALRPHILLREWSQHASETEKLELLLHELGHYLGAAHSPEPDSVMRPVLGDRLARKKDFVIRFDPVNTLLMSMVGEEVRRRRVSSFAEIGAATRNRMQEIYKILGYTRPEDPAAGALARQLGQERTGDPLSDAVRSTINSMTQAARNNSQLPLAAEVAAGPTRVEGDALFEELVRLAAREAAKAPAELQAKVFLLAIGIAVGDPEQLNRLPAIAPVLNRIETPAERSVRTTYIGQPTARGRYDLARHFSVAAMLVGLQGQDSAETLSVAKELLDSSGGGTGFSFADLAADKAGIRLAKDLLAGKLKLDTVAENFSVDRYLPDIRELPEGMTTMQFINQYGGKDDPRFVRMMEEIELGINELPAYKTP